MKPCAGPSSPLPAPPAQGYTAAHMAKRPSQRPDAPSPQKARQILADKEIRGHPLTTKQQGFFGAVAATVKKAR